MRTTLNGAVLLDPSHRWQCPSCDATYVTHEARPHVPMHPCPGLGGVLAPYVEVAVSELRKHSVRHVVKLREDYIGDEIVRTDATGRPVMAVVTERADGSNDCHAFAGVATHNHQENRP